MRWMVCHTHRIRGSSSLQTPREAPSRQDTQQISALHYNPLCSIMYGYGKGSGKFKGSPYGGFSNDWKDPYKGGDGYIP